MPGPDGPWGVDPLLVAGPTTLGQATGADGRGGPTEPAQKRRGTTEPHQENARTTPRVRNQADRNPPMPLGSNLALWKDLVFHRIARSCTRFSQQTMSSRRRPDQRLRASLSLPASPGLPSCRGRDNRRSTSYNRDGFFHYWGSNRSRRFLHDGHDPCLETST